MDINRSTRARQHRPGTFTIIDNAVINLIRFLGALAFAVYCVLAKHSSSKDGTCYPSVRAIAEATGSTKTSVRRALKVLEVHGLVARKRRRRKDGGNASNLYNLQCIPPVDLVTRKHPPTDTRAPGGGDIGAPGLVTQQHHEPDPLEPNPNNQIQGTNLLSAEADDHSSPPVPQLLDLIDGWNELGPSIARPVRRDPPSKALLEVYKRLSRDPEMREAFQDIPALMTAIRKATFCHGQGWFTLPWLFTTDPKTKELRVQKILNGAYSNNGDKQDQQRVSADRFIHDPDRPLGAL